MNRIIRVFPVKTSFTPKDDMVFIGEPPGLIIPPHDSVHISCTFTWDRELCEHLKLQWEAYTDKPVLLGGPAYGSPAYSFTPGLYVKSGIVFTSRGCNNACSWCPVPEREGKIYELPVCEGNIIQDNNFLQTSREHKDEIFAMLKHQKRICFKGGLQCNLLDDHFISNVRKLRIAELWLACDTDAAIPGMQEAVQKLKDVRFRRDQIRCYALIGDDMRENELRLKAIYAAGAMPFAQLYQPPGEHKRRYSNAWRKFHRMWSRPASISAHVEKGTSMWDFNT